MSETLIGQLAAKISAEHAAVTGDNLSSLNHAKRCGELLIVAKAELGHGQLQTFVVQQCGLSPRRAQMYMQVAKGWPLLEEQRRKGVSLFSLRECLDWLRR